MKSFALLLLLMGIVFITIGYTKQTMVCKPPRIVYRTVPRSILDEQMEGNLEDVSSMFESQDPFLKGK